MSQIPRTREFDSSLALLREGYPFVTRRTHHHGSDVFWSRVMLRKAVFAVGEEAATEFYQPGRMTRKRALPVTALKLLQDKGSVQVLDGDAHGWRKQMFLSIMTPSAIQRLTDIVSEEWRHAVRRWATAKEVVLFHEVQEVLCRAVCAWAAVPLGASEVERRTAEFAAMIDGAGSVGPRNWRGMLLRSRTERWARNVVEQLRSGHLEAPPDSPASIIASHRDHEGNLLDRDIAAVELINVLRPTVAVAYFITFAALALHQHPRSVIDVANAEDLRAFVQEVRRFYPMFPIVGGRVLQEFDWRGHHFSKGTWLLLDLYGTNHDPRSWDEPGAFRPERFRKADPGAFRFIPQGGGEYDRGHRCAGEWLTIALLTTAVRLLQTSMAYDVPPQDLRIDLSRLPTLPNSGFMITNVRAATR